MRLRWLLTGAIALHVVDDSFLQPQPGTSAGDHLAGGIVPVAALAAAAALLPRVRAGLRGALTLLIGIAGVTAGSEAAYFTATGHASGDDWTGLLALVAGVAMLVLGTRDLWRSRRRRGSPLRRNGQRLAVLAGSVLVGYLVVLQFALGYGTTHIASPEVPEVDLGRPFQDVTVPSADGVALSGWYVPSRNRAAVVIVAMGRMSPGPHARMLAGHGYGVLVIDPRGWGRSHGDPNAFGWAGSKDVRGAVDWVAARPEVDAGRVGGLGLSVGGEMMIQAAAESDALAAVVSEGAGERSVREFLSAVSGPDWLGLPQYAALTTSVALFGNDTPPPGLEDLAGRVGQPMLLVYGEHGQALERDLNPRYAAAAGASATLWEVPGSGHMGGLDAQPAEYERRVVGFLDRALG
ncbi:MAG TPA: CocE/NonD family hydrolase [Miltoncostaeaceae bacterium]|nr:CocE/NonD family hydrolase [Miltoncostaeaceae bacterium]